MSNRALNDLIQRFAISALSRERKAEALNEEILVGKYSGEFYIKTKDGLMMSVDIINRAKSATNEAIRIAELMGMTGNIYHVNFDRIVLPNFFDYGVNILQQEIVDLPIGAKELLIHLDIDEYEIVGDVPQLAHSNGMVKLILEAEVKGVAQYIRVNKSLADVNFVVIPLDEIQGMTSLKLINITIEADANSDVNCAPVVHNLFVTVNI